MGISIFVILTDGGMDGWMDGRMDGSRRSHDARVKQGSVDNTESNEHIRTLGVAISATVTK